MAYTYSDSCYSDLHKDARGCRPSFGNMAYWDDLEPAEKQKQWDALVEEMNARHEDELRWERICIRDFEQQVADLLAGSPNKTREQAVKWIIDGLDVDGDLQYACYKLGLPYGYLDEGAV